MTLLELLGSGTVLATLITSIVSLVNSSRTEKETLRRLSEQEDRTDKRASLIEKKISERSHLDRTYERKVFLREKYEEFGFTVTSSMANLMVFPNFKYKEAFEYWDKKITPAVENSQIYSLIYFPEIDEINAKLSLKIIEIWTFYLTNTDEKSNESVIKQLEPMAYTSLMTEYKKTKLEWISTYQKLAPKYTSLADTDYHH